MPKSKHRRYHIIMMCIFHTYPKPMSAVKNRMSRIYVKIIFISRDALIMIWGKRAWWNDKWYGPGLGINATVLRLRPWINVPSSSSSSSSRSPVVDCVTLLRPTVRVVISNSLLLPHAGCYDRSFSGFITRLQRSGTDLREPVHQPINDKNGIIRTLLISGA